MTAGAPPGRPRTVYGRRKGRKLREGQQRRLATLLPTLLVTPPDAGRLDLAAVFGTLPPAVWLEIGFGGGEHLAAQAEANPAIGFLGAEVFENGIAKLLAEIEARRLANIRICREDARRLVRSLPDASIGRAFILFPDPWPKLRHHKRRIVSTAMLDQLARVMTPGAELRIATDDEDYLTWILERATAHPAFRWLARTADDWRRRPADWPPTRYEQKAVAQGRKATFLRFMRA